MGLVVLATTRHSEKAPRCVCHTLRCPCPIADQNRTYIVLHSLGVRSYVVAVALELLSLHNISHRNVLAQTWRPHSPYAACRKHFKNKTVIFVILSTKVIPAHCKIEPPKLQIIQKCRVRVNTLESYPQRQLQVIIGLFLNSLKTVFSIMYKFSPTSAMDFSFPLLWLTFFTQQFILAIFPNDSHRRLLFFLMVV